MLRSYSALWRFSGVFIVLVLHISVFPRTPQYPFKADLEVKTVAFKWDDLSGLSILVANNDSLTYDSMQMRIYFNATTAEMGISGKEDDTTYQFGGELNLAILFREDGFEDTVPNRAAIQRNFYSARLVKMTEMHDSASGKYIWYMPLNCNGIHFRPGTGLRLDLLWDSFEPTYNVDHLLVAPRHTPGVGDWSYTAKKRSEGYPADFAGIQNSGRDSIDNPILEIPNNPYVAIFRNDQLIYGLPPDWKKYYSDTFDTIPRPRKDPMPYDMIAVPFGEYTEQLTRDSANIRISPFRVNQAGYRPGDKKYFYYVGSASSFSVVKATDGSVVATGTLASTGKTTSGQMKITGCSDALNVSGGAIKYILTGAVTSGTISEGVIPDLPEGKYKIKADSVESSPFVIRSNVYNMVKDALIKFYGVNRCGDSKSWFHPACHLKDSITGGWHDCGDHLKEAATMSYTSAVLGLASSVFADRDEDVYNADQGITHTTDGIPDVLYEAKHGADFVLQSYEKAGGEVGKMITSVGGFGNPGFGDDHTYWGRPENQDKMAASRGGPPRCARNEPTTDYLGKYAANLAFVSKQIKPYDAQYADRCLKAAKAIYEFTKPKLDITNTSAYNGATIVSDDAAFGCLALLWATGERQYLDDLCYDKTIGARARSTYPKLFQGGWFTNNDPLFSKNVANTDWPSTQTHVLWGFFRLILNDKDFCRQVGLTEAERLSLIEKTVYNLIANLSSVSLGTQTIPLPDGGTWVPSIIKYDLPWFTMHTQTEWVWNQYQAGNITDVFYYYDIASKIQGLELPNTPASTNWKAEEVKTVLVRMLDYMLGVNPWDISMISGIGSKNLNHPHHRAANPELRNSFSDYDYRHLVGALAGGNTPSESLYVESAKDYLHSEVGINGTTNILIPVIGLSIAEQKVHVRPIANMGRTLRTSLQIIPLRSSGALLVKSGKPMRSIALYTISGRVVERKVFSDKCPLSVQLQTDRDRIAGNELYVIRVLFNNGEIVGKKIATMTR